METILSCFINVIIIITLFIIKTKEK